MENDSHETPQDKYHKLKLKNDYDQEAAEQLADAMNEVRRLQALIDDNEELRPYVWTTADGRSAALHKLEDDHLKNIMTWIVNVNGVAVPRAIKAEALKRGFPIPRLPKSSPTLNPAELPRLLSEMHNYHNAIVNGDVQAQQLLMKSHIIDADDYGEVD
jgi:hypothetical protein